jgi:long-subunit fatty acid transport protein
MVFAVGYNRVNDFTGQMSFSAFNGVNSLIPKLYSKTASDDLAWNLGLEDTTGYTPLQKNLTQQGKITESGGLNQWAFSGSIEVMRNLSLGLTLGIVTGSYRWDRQYSELDTKNLYQGVIAGRADVTDFREFRLDESMMQDYSGWDATFGLIYNHEDRARVGLSIKTPSFVTVKENFSGTARSFFADASYRVDGYPMLNYSDYQYDVRTPWILSLGVSGTPVDFLTLAASIDAIDYTQMQFSGAQNRSDELALNDLNDQIRGDLRSTLNWHAGAEASIPGTGLQVRGGYQLRKSPYKDDPSDYDTKTLSFGLGYLFENTFQVNVTWVHSSYNTFQKQLFSAVPDYSTLGDEFKFRTDEKRTSTGLMFSIAYRF